MSSGYDEVIDFLAGGMTSEELIAFRPSAAASARFEWLLLQEKTERLLPQESEELDRLMQIERVLSLAKARARVRLNQRDQ